MKRTEINRVNSKRMKHLREEQFGDEYREWIIRLPCAMCQRYDPEAGSQPAHMKSRGAGGKAQHLLPLCSPCHRNQETASVAFRTIFGLKYEMSVFEVAELYYDVFHGESGWLI